MSIEAITFVKLLDLGERESPCARLLMQTIAENLFNDSGLCRVGQAELALQTRVSIRTVARHLKALAFGHAVVVIHPQYSADMGRTADAIEIVGFKPWLAECREKSSKKVPANLSDRPPVKMSDRGPIGQPDQRTMVSGTEENLTSEVNTTPLAPSPTEGVQALIDDLKSEVEASGGPTLAINLLIAPLATLLPITHANPAALLFEINAKFSGHTAARLSALAAETKCKVAEFPSLKRLVSLDAKIAAALPAHANKSSSGQAIRTTAPRLQQKRITPDDKAQWSSWMRKLPPDHATLAASTGYILANSAEGSRWPGPGVEIVFPVVETRQ
jgi:hypothetical protein